MVGASGVRGTATVGIGKVDRSFSCCVFVIVVGCYFAGCRRVVVCTGGQPVKLAGCSPPQFTHFGRGGAGRFWAIFRCVLLVTFYVLGGSAAEG
jgi:hypothetical protein